MFNYAQLDENNICVVVSALSAEINQDNMIPLQSQNAELLKCRYVNNTFEKDIIVDGVVTDTIVISEF